MSRMSILARSTAIALCLPASAALADLTSAEVWADWKSYMEGGGYDITGTESTNGGTLTVSGLNMDFDLGADTSAGATSIKMGTLRFVEQGDGSVAIELPAQTSIEVQSTTETGDTFTVTATYEQTDPVMTATGDPDELTYDYSAPSARAALTGLTINGAPVPSEVARAVISITDMNYSTTTSVDVLRKLEQTVKLSALAYDMAFDDPAGGGNFKLQGAMNDVTVNGLGQLPTETNPQDLNAMLDAGFDINAVFATLGGNYSLSFSGPDGSGTVNSNSEGGNIEITMGAKGLIYDILQRNVDFTMLVTEFPLPLSFSAAELGSRVLIPLQGSPDEQEFGLSVNLSDFAMSDVIWSLFDPSSQLPRDPASLEVDLSGKAKVLFDFLDPSQAIVLEQTGAAPGELNTLTLNKLELDAAGAKLTGSGDFTFDNSDLITFDGVPRPLGELDLQLVGANGLLDKLIAMGLVPEEQAMGARLMMGLFAVPGDAPDTLNSRIEVNPEGHVLANGQRLR